MPTRRRRAPAAAAPAAIQHNLNRPAFAITRAGLPPRPGPMVGQTVPLTPYVLHSYQSDFLASLAAAQGLTSPAAALEGIVSRAMAESGVKAAIFDALQCIHCGSADPADWIDWGCGKQATALVLNAPEAAFLAQPLLLQVERVGEPPAKQLVPGPRSVDASKAARCCIDWAIKEYGALMTGQPTVVPAQTQSEEDLQLSLADIRSLLGDEEPRALQLLVEAAKKTTAPELLASASEAVPPPPLVEPAALALGDGATAGRSDLKTISLAEVAQHNQASDFWFVIHGKVYDMTAYASEHPGGFGVLNQYAGKVADEGFDGNHTPAVLAEQPAVKLLGEVPASELAAAAEAQAEAEEPAQPIKFPEMSDCLNTYDFAAVAQRRMKPQHMACEYMPPRVPLWYLRSVRSHWR
jgi:cytochrome b involved in lipid metabolism